MRSYKELTYLKKPSKLITKPLFAVMILRGTFVKGPYPSDWHEYNALEKIWTKTKKQLREPNFLTSLEQFDIRSVT